MMNNTSLQSSNVKVIQLKIMKKSDAILTYMNNKTQKQMKYFNLIGVNGKEVYHIRVYLMSKFDMFTKGMCYKFQNVIQKSENELWVTSSSAVAYTGLVDTEEDIILPPLPEENPKDGQNLSIQSAIKSPSKSVVTGKIVKVSPIKHVQEGTLPVKSLILKDKTATAKVCLFGKNAELNFEMGNMVEVSAVYPKVYCNVTQLTSTALTKCQFLPPNDEIDLLHEEENNQWKNDADFQEEKVDEQENIQLTDIINVDIYDVCQNDACRNKKLINNTCPSCKGTDAKMVKYFKVIFMYQTDKKEDQKITLFKNTISNIIKMDLDFNSKEDVIQFLVEKLPIQCTASITPNNTLYNIK
ncbi:hypothetical protein KUTeg_005733 [Tegillarca granosa]|uniref:Uncharacterized protein n=1 Tax=Tegillarca granosa TaxID=220873 RepID=A0ABQ9E544_TEGGR|nr:hypothetical protein KUTeg_021749 [Tegillarca granosa]KAJ8304859.1 hypothetical protein KUTeg_018442 [Tegillarca granosa]KAJ8316714.1 hypothetical protein KUTeg_005733 [Tegillarca granosa]